MKLFAKDRTTILCDRCHGRGPFTKGEVCDNCRAQRENEKQRRSEVLETVQQVRAAIAAGM
jgi:DnaJ-class molecular chaperone